MATPHGATDTLTAAWLNRWAEAPSAVALTVAGGEVRWSAAELEERTRATAERLAARGVVHGARVIVSGAPSADLVVAYVALLRLGAAPVPTNTAYLRAELEHIVSACHATFAVIDDPKRVESLVPAATPSTLATGPRSACDLDLCMPGDVAMVAFTSGTTGQPKAAVHLHRTLLAGARSVVEAWQWLPHDTLLLALPLFHMHGLGVGVHGSLTAGAAMHLLPTFDPVAVRSAAAATTMFFGVPTMYARLSDALGGLSGQRLLVSGSAPLDPVLFGRISEACGQAPLERYGMTETVMITGNPLHGERRAGSVGLPLPGVHIRLDDVTGEVLVRSPAVFAGYEADGRIVPPPEWFATGDIGAVDDDGYLRLVGRASELIITGGYNVYPREVEDAVREHPDVVDVAVVGVPDAVWGETVVAAYVGGAEPHALADHLRDRLASYKQPRAWCRVDDLPRNSMGKVQRTAVKELFT